MKQSIPFCLPCDISPEVFLRDYWQKKPLLIRNGLPSLVGMFEPEDVLALATEEEVSARLVGQNLNNWTLKHSPLSANDIDGAPERWSHWSVLIQNLEAWSPELGLLWQAFDFIPKWQQDDIMVSFAPDGGSVGAHFDDYDVFLAQGYGERRWQLGKFCDENTAFVSNQPIRLLDEMGELIFDEVLTAGDVLYVPPRLAHHGVAMGDCLTFSFGFRRPSLVQVLDKIADVATSEPKLFKPLILPQSLQKNANALTVDSANAIKQALIELLQSPKGDALFARALGELVSRRQYELLKFDDDIDDKQLLIRLQDGERLAINPASRFVWQQALPTFEVWYINGECVHLDNMAHDLLGKFLQGDVLGMDALNQIDMTQLACWVNDNWLIFQED